MRIPGKVAYVALLGTSTLGTLSSNIISAPLNEISRDLRATSAQTVLAVSAFTIAMVLFAPLAGWMCERFGPKRFLVISMAVMVLTQLAAATSPGPWMLIAMRACQGLACSAVPPAVQQTLSEFWPHRRGRVMAAWASAIGVGQAIGPPLGGVITDTAGWRGIFVAHATLSAAMVLLLARFVPAIAARRPPLHVTGMAALIVGVGSMVGALTWAGQAHAPVAQIGMAMLGAGALTLYVRLSRKGSSLLVAPALLIEARYLRSTAAAATVMAALGAVVVTVPLFLAQRLELRPGTIGVITFALAASMTVFAPVSSRIAERVTPRRVLHGGLITLVAGPLVLALLSSHADSGSRAAGIAGMVAALVVIGCGIGSAQSVAALGVMRSPAAAYGWALGIHNMLRFSGLAVGYAWVALTYPSGNLYLVFAGPAAMAAGTFALTLVGGPAAPVEERVGAGVAGTGGAS